MSNLTKYLKKKKIKSFSEIRWRFIINYSRLGTAELDNDQEMISIQEHLIMLKDQNPKNLQYMVLVYLDEDITESGQKVKRSFYVSPKHTANIGVLGGTFIEGAINKTPNTKEFNILLQLAKDFYGIK